VDRAAVSGRASRADRVGERVRKTAAGKRDRASGHQGKGPHHWHNAGVSYLAVTVVGHDRPGIIASAAAILASAGMNLEDSSMTLLRGHFAMTLICAGDTPASEVESALLPLVDDALDVTVREVPHEDDQPPLGEPYLVTVHGADRLGIVARLAGVIAAAGGNITDLTTRLTGGLYVLIAEVDLPTATDVDDLRAEITRVASELGVEATLRPLERDEL
jgi:glycine cleavage system transcriptional repressor